MRFGCQSLVALASWTSLFLSTTIRAENNYNNGNNQAAYTDDRKSNLENYGVATDDQYVMYNEDGQELTFDGISVMPVSCINYNGGNLIKFQLFENSNSYKCHFRQLGTFVVSIAHFMRAYFNYQALTKGNEFSLPSDAAYLNCVLIQATQYLDQQLYAKVGCLSDETVTSTRFSLHVFTDNKCSQPIDDSYKIKNGYLLGEFEFSNRVSFRPPFYSCLSCKPEKISDTFHKDNNWYDDYLINVQGGNKVYAYDDDSNNDNSNINDDVNATAAYYSSNGDDANNAYYVANNGDDAKNDAYTSQYFQQADDDVSKNYKSNNDDANKYYAAKTDDASNAAANDDAGNRRSLLAAPSAVESFSKQFWDEVEYVKRELSNGRSADIGNWNFCQRLHHYSMKCDESCLALDSFRVNEWSNSDIFLLVIMCIFMAAMMLLIFAKRVKAYEKAHIYGDDFEASYPGLPPMAMVLLFGIILAAIILAARLKFVNETLVFAVITCILLFIYMLKLTLFENRGPNLLGSDRREDPNIAFDNMNRQLFDA